ncbi:hypothetical protein BDZ97DRAFT_1914962 [Flammula alnicola]|nr:hypothetical protein BDZ97DRAFT_1914962 [Flammula alnicola]
MRPSAKITDAFSVLGLGEGASLDVVKMTYKQIALRTHPDKNPENPDATAEFQRVSEAYRVLLKHLDQSSKPSARPQTSHPFFGFHDHGYDDYSEDDYDYDDYGYDEDDSESDDDIAFYLWLFEQMMASRSEYGRREHRFRRQAKHETPEEYQERLRRSREQQLAAQERRKQEAAARKERAAREREQERLEAEQRQKSKIEAKKAQAEAARRSSEERAKEIQRKAQETRSSVFAAARRGESEKVKKGVWENAVDAAGGEIKSGCSTFVKNKPQDLQETLLHIATKNGDLDLVKWLDSHSADPEERNSQGLTAFQLALKSGQLAIVNHFLETYPPQEHDSKAIYDCTECSNLISLALESREPEHVWLILDKKMATPQEISQAWTWATSDKGLQILKDARPSPHDIEKAEDIIKLLARYGGFSPTTPQEGAESNSGGESPKSHQAPTPSQEPQPRKTVPTHPKQNNYRGRGRGRGRSRGAHLAPPAH